MPAPPRPARADLPSRRLPLALADTPLDAFLAVVALLTIAAGALLYTGGRGRTVELVLVALAMGWAYWIGFRVGRLVAFAIGVLFLLLENHYGRLTAESSWRELAVLAAIMTATMASGALRTELERLRARSRALAGELESIASQRALDVKLSGGKPISQLEYELERSRRHNHEVSLLLVRPDGFDEIGLRFGETAAELTLERIAETIGSNLRATDIPLRQGVFDFAVILPETSLEAARSLAERTRLAINSVRIDLGENEEIELSVSIGIAAFPTDAQSNEELVSSTRRALSVAVEQGGNRTVLHSLPPDAPSGWGLGPRAAPGFPEQPQTPGS